MHRHTQNPPRIQVANSIPLDTCIRVSDLLPLQAKHAAPNGYKWEHHLDKYTATIMSTVQKTPSMSSPWTVNPSNGLKGQKR